MSVIFTRIVINAANRAKLNIRIRMTSDNPALPGSTF